MFLPKVTGILPFRKFPFMKALNSLSLPAQHSTEPQTLQKPTGGISVLYPASRSTFEACTYQIQTSGKGKAQKRNYSEYRKKGNKSWRLTQRKQHENTRR